MRTHRWREPLLPRCLLYTRIVHSPTAAIPASRQRPIWGKISLIRLSQPLLALVRPCRASCPHPSRHLRRPPASAPPKHTVCQNRERSSPGSQPPPLFGPAPGRESAGKKCCENTVGFVACFRHARLLCTGSRRGGEGHALCISCCAARRRRGRPEPKCVQKRAF